MQNRADRRGRLEEIWPLTPGGWHSFVGVIDIDTARAPEVDLWGDPSVLVVARAEALDRLALAALSGREAAAPR